MTFRWYGEKDCIPLNYIKQIQGMSGVVTAVYDTPVGEVWDVEKLERLKRLSNDAGLEMEVIESVPVHEDIKLGKPSRDKYIEAYKQNIINCGKVGVKCICYNFMPVFDWLRTDLYFKHKDGATSLAYDHEKLLALDPKNLHLPGWDESYGQDELNALLKEYEGMTHQKLFDNLVYFLKAIMPACDEAGVNMAIHPDDPPWDMFGLPRIIARKRITTTCLRQCRICTTASRSAREVWVREDSTTFRKWRRNMQIEYTLRTFVSSNTTVKSIFTKTDTRRIAETWTCTELSKLS